MLRRFPSASVCVRRFVKLKTTHTENCGCSKVGRTVLLPCSMCGESQPVAIIMGASGSARATQRRSVWSTSPHRRAGHLAHPIDAKAGACLTSASWKCARVAALVVHGVLSSPPPHERHSNGASCRPAAALVAPAGLPSSVSAGARPGFGLFARWVGLVCLVIDVVRVPARHMFNTMPPSARTSGIEDRMLHTAHARVRGARARGALRTRGRRDRAPPESHSGRATSFGGTLVTLGRSTTCSTRSNYTCEKEACREWERSCLAVQELS